MKVKSLSYGQNSYKQSPINNEFISLYGIGDGGAGPAPEHVERALRMQNFEGTPRVKFARADKFFERMAKFNNYPTWVGELYLELHRGCLTTQGRVKLFNRQLEEELVKLEMMFASSNLQNYPTELFDSLWKTLLINQFHDIIPGSSITEVYQETDEDYAAMFDLCERLTHQLNNQLFDNNENYLSIVNSLSYDGSILVDLPSTWQGAATKDGEKLIVANGKILVNLPAMSCVELQNSEKLIDDSVAINDTILENELILYRFDQSGQLVEIFDKEQNINYLNDTDKGNIFTIYSDYPDFYEAWDINKEYRDQVVENAEVTSIEKVTNNSLYSELKIEFTIGNSKISQLVKLKSNSKLLSFETNVDWQECRKMLRVGFATKLAPTKINCDIQYGYYERPNHLNTSWEHATFEYCCHKYLDLSERNYGIALLNDSKYGCYVKENFFDLALLRSPKYPDFYADLGSHQFTYALLPHSGDLVASNVMSEAAFLNRTPMYFAGRNQNFEFPVSVNSQNVTLEVIKKATKSDRVVVRLVEKLGVAGKATISSKKFNKISQCNLIEWEEQDPVTINENGLELEFKPFEIKTFILS